MPSKVTALRRRIAPWVPLVLDIKESDDEQFSVAFHIGFDFNVAAAIQEKTGLALTDFSIWAHIGEPGVLRAMLWASVLGYSPEYDTVDADGEPSNEGLEVIGSYIDESNCDQIFEAVWSAYLLYLAPKKREAAIKWRADAEAKGKDEVTDPNVPKPVETPEVTSMGRPSTGLTSGPSPDTTSASAMSSSAS